MKKKSIGIIVARFQEPTIKLGHLELITHVQARHDEVAIVLGITRTKGSKRDPLDFETRAQMIREVFPRVHIRSIVDEQSDELWSTKLDSLIEKDFGGIHRNKAILYGGRNSFIPHYKGKFTTQQVPTFGKKNLTATKIRLEVGKKPLPTEDFRNGVIYGSQNQFPRVFITVDIAITRWADDSLLVLLGKKHMDGEIRFPGGFVDPTDNNLELAAKRELMEEAPGISVEGPMTYLGSFLLDDWRYRDDDKIMTSLFHGEYTWGNTEAGDDLVFVDWFPLNKATRDKIWSNHRNLFVRLEKHVKHLKQETTT